MNEQIINALNWRYATQVFDPTKKVSEEDLQTILESGRLAPSSYGHEPWKLIIVNNAELRKRIREAGYDQPKITEASHLIVIAVRTDVKEKSVQELIDRTKAAQNKSDEDLAGLRAALEGSVAGDPQAVLASATCQTFIPLGMMIETAALLGIDNGPMGGFNSAHVDEILGLKERNLHSVTLLALGYRGNDHTAERAKVRRSWDDAIEVVN